MKQLLIAALVAVVAAQALAESPRHSRNVIPSWGDMTLVYGPGTDPAMDTEQAMENMVRHWKGRGFTGVYLRSDLAQFPPGAVIRHDRGTQPQPTLAVAWHLIDEIMEKCDPHEAARRAAEKHAFEYWIWHPHIYSEGSPLDAGEPGVGRMVPWSYASRYFLENPETITVDRDGNRQWMVPEYAYPGARAHKAEEFAYMAKTYRPTGIIASMRSESSQLISPPDHADQYGFNPLVVEEMKRLYGVDIRTDPRFDWKNAEFKLDDPMLENWRRLRGSHITQLYREIRQAMRKAAPEVKLAVALSGERVGPILSNATLEWRTWIDEGIVDVILLPVTFEATLDLEANKKGYLTDVRAGKGLVTAQRVKQYIRKSKHPNIQVIQTGAPSYFYPDPPPGADGWQCDVWYDSYHLAWYQRWEQWKKDLADHGAIKFFEQDFDSFPVKSRGIGGGFGDGRYHPDLRACPGVWYNLGDGTGDRPCAQQEIRRGGSGSAMRLAGRELIGMHHSSPDRSLLTGQAETAIANGKATFSSWVYRETDASTLEIFLTGNAHYEKDVGLRVAPNSGRLLYTSGRQWIESPLAVPEKQWMRITFDVDVDAGSYSAFLGEQRQAICEGVAYAPPAERFVTQHGVNVPIKVPSYRIFNTLMFVPTNGSREPVYVDDVLVRWTPTRHDAQPGRRKILDETFESATPSSSQFGREGDWRISAGSGSGSPFVVENTTSFGRGVHCIRATGGGMLAAELGQQLTAAPAKGPITLDLDVYIRSDKGFPYILPDPTTSSPHSVVFGLERFASGQPFAAVDSAGGTWRLWDGRQFVDSGKRVVYDVWNHLRIAIDPQSKRYRLVVQPVGELPSVIGEAAVGSFIDENEKLRLTIKPSATAGHISCYDNIMVTSSGS